MTLTFAYFVLVTVMWLGIGAIIGNLASGRNLVTSILAVVVMAFALSSFDKIWRVQPFMALWCAAVGFAGVCLAARLSQRRVKS